MIWNNTHNFIVSNFNFNNNNNNNNKHHHKRHHHHHQRGSASSSVRLPSSSSSWVTAAVITTTTTATTAMILMHPSKCEASTNNNKKNNNNNNNINPIVAGAFAGAVARVFVAPLDVIKIRLQIQKENYSLTNAKYKGAFSAMATIAREEGIRKGLWAGTIPALCLWIPYTGIQFGMLNALNSSSSLSSSSSSSFLNNNFVFGAVAGATATVATYPFDIIRTQLASQGIPKTYNGVFDAFFGLLRRRKLYAGLGITLIEIIPATSVQFGVYEYLNSIGKESSNTNNSSGSSGSSRSSSSNSSSFELNHFAKGFLAGSCARVAIHPLDVMKKRLQVVGLKRAASYGAAETANKAFPLVLSILKTEGVRGFYKGLVPALCKSAPSSAITFGVYEFAMQVLDSFTNSLDEQE
jgi:solute carrier family 25 thiamine pyrophosphate transporter 19